MEALDIYSTFHSNTSTISVNILILTQTVIDAPQSFEIYNSHIPKFSLNISNLIVLDVGSH